MNEKVQYSYDGKNWCRIGAYEWMAGLGKFIRPDGPSYEAEQIARLVAKKSKSKFWPYRGKVWRRVASTSGHKKGLPEEP
jgi:hypothetical protein